jgi:hypothetical protein
MEVKKYYFLCPQASRLLIREQEVADCESFVYTNTSYRQYFHLTMQGRYNPPSWSCCKY